MLLEQAALFLQNSPENILFYSSTKLLLKSVKKISVIFKNSSLVTHTIEMFIWLYNQWIESLKYIKSPMEDINPVCRQQSKILIKLMSILRRNYNTRSGQEQIIFQILPILSAFYLEDNQLCQRVGLDTKVARASFKMLRLLITVTGNFLLNEYTLDIKDVNTFNLFAEKYKSNLKKIADNFMVIFYRICFISQSCFYQRLLCGASQDEAYIEFLFSQFSNEFALQLCLVKDKKMRETLPVLSNSDSFNLSNWLLKEDLESISEFEWYCDSWYSTPENSMQECGLKFLRILTDFYSEENMLDQFAEYVKKVLLEYSLKILQTGESNPNQLKIYFLNEQKVPELNILNLLLYAESNMYQLLQQEDFEDVIKNMMLFPLELLDLPLLGFIESYFQNCYGNLNLREAGLHFSWRLLESNRLLLSYTGIRIFLIILLKFQKSQILELNLNFSILFEKFERLLIELSNFSSDCLSHFLELIRETIVALPFSPEILEVGLNFLESLWTKNLPLSSVEVFLKSCQMMVDFFVEADFSLLQFSLCQRLAKYISGIIDFYEQTRNIVILENCFYPLICCFLFKMEKYFGKAN